MAQMQTKSKTYDEFVEKFKPKLTTDDCYTPQEVYEAVKNWAVNEYNLDEEKIVRPFYPGGDFENYDYEEGAIVLDNPPFSILAKIIDFYNEKNINYFLFAPSLTMLGYLNRCNFVFAKSQIIYENGARVNTGFVTNLGDKKIKTSPQLKSILQEIQGKKAKRIICNKYPKNLVTFSFIEKIVVRNRNYEIDGDCVLQARTYQFFDEKTEQFTRKKIFGCAFWVPDKIYEEITKLSDTTPTAPLGEQDAELVKILNEKYRAKYG